MALRKSTQVSIRIAFITFVILAATFSLESLLEMDEFWSNLTLTIVLPVSCIFIVQTNIRQYKKAHLSNIYDALHVPYIERQLRHKANMEVDDEVLDIVKTRKEEIDLLKEKESYRKEFLGNVSHELKTPIFLIQSCLETLLEGGMEDPKINKKYLLKAIGGTGRLNQLVEDLIKLNQMELGRLNPEKTKVDIVNLSKNCIEELKIKAEASQIKILIDTSNAAPVFADQNMLTQVFINLLSNSIKYGKENGMTSIHFHDLNEKILVEIKDDGIGISSDDLPRIFERFYRVEKSRNRDKGGTGIGLAIVKHIIEAHGETITVNSSENEGSSFCFTLTKAN